MICEQFRPIKTVEPICCLNWPTAEGDHNSLIKKAKWNTSQRFRVVSDGITQRTLPVDKEDVLYLTQVSSVYNQIGEFKPNRILEVGINTGLSLSPVLDRYQPKHVEATNIFFEEEDVLRTQAPGLYSQIESIHAGTLDAIIKLRLMNKKFNLIQAVRSFGNSDTTENNNIIAQYLFWMGQLQNPGDMLVGSVYTDEFLDLARQAWEENSIYDVHRATFHDSQDLETLLQECGYSLITYRENDETDSYRRFFSISVPSKKDRKTELIFAARKNIEPIQLDPDDIRYLEQWLSGYIRCNPYQTEDLTQTIGQLQDLNIFV